MKVIFLNALRAELRDPLVAFLSEHAPTTDVFCFQESNAELEAICRTIMPQARRVTAEKFISKGDQFDQLTVIRAGIACTRVASVLADTPGTGLGLYTELELDGRVIHLVNCHGRARPGDKLDTPERLAQSRGIIDFAAGLSGVRIIGGDLNLLPQARSLTLFEEAGYRDLIRQFAIPTTRNDYAWRKYPGQEQRYSDYVFVSGLDEPAQLTVPDITISDHLPLILEF